jgi:hypothetical protein
MWLVESSESNEVAPPVIYGVVPPGATEIHAPEPLVAGTTYSLALRLFPTGELLAHEEFTP